MNTVIIYAYTSVFGSGDSADDLACSANEVRLVLLA